MAKLHKNRSVAKIFINFVSRLPREASALQFNDISKMKIFTTEDLRAIERRTIETEGTGSRELINRMARGAADEIVSRWRPTRPMIIFAGHDNNGATALATAIQLVARGYRPTIYLFNIGGNRLSHDCRDCRDELLAAAPDINFMEVDGRFNIPALNSRHLIIDGLFGSGLREPLAGGFVILVRYINESKATVVSLDVPSGLLGDLNTTTINRDVIHATLTLAVQMPRISFFMRDNAELVGEWKCIDIGLSHDAIHETDTNYHLVEGTEVCDLIRPRNPFANKADCGSALIVAGSYGMMGAAVLSARGALRAGAGKVTVHAPQCGYEVIQSSVPEALFHPDANKIVVSDIKLEHEFNAIGVGPGLGTNEMTINALELFLKTRSKPVVLDADALNCIAQRPGLLKELPVLSVLTPHAGEFDRIFGEQHSDSARLLRAIEVSHALNILILLKGHYTALVRPDYKVYFNSTGTPGMATGGSGDVLTGVITAFMAQGYKPEVSALIGAYVHGVAGELATREHGEFGVTAGDIAANIGKAIRLVAGRTNELENK